MNHKKTLDKKRVGLNLYHAIHKSGRTYEDIAEYLNLASPRVIYAWMSGEKLPSIENLWNLSFLLQVKMEDILS